MLECFAFVDAKKHYYIRMGGFTIHRKPSLQIILAPPRMEKCITAGDELHRVLEAFLKSAETNGGDPIAVNLIKEFCIMAKNKVLVVDTKEKKVAKIAANAEKAAEFVTEAGEAGSHMKVIATVEEFDGLKEGVRLAIAATNADVATLPKEDQLARAYEVACKPVKVEKAPPKARAKGVKGLIRELFAVPGACHTIPGICELTHGSAVSVKTAISDLRSATYCKPGEPLNLSRIGHTYALLSAEEAERIEKAAEAAKAADKVAKAEAKAEAKAAKAAEKETEKETA